MKTVDREALIKETERALMAVDFEKLTECEQARMMPVDPKEPDDLPVKESIRRLAERIVDRYLEAPEKPAVQKAPKGLPPFDANGLGRMPTDHYVAEHLGAQMLAGKDWHDKQGGWEPKPQGPPSIY